MSDLIQVYFDEYGIAKAYDDTYDITIHCETEEEYNKAIEILERTNTTATWIGKYSPYKCDHCGHYSDTAELYCCKCGSKMEVEYE